LATEAVGEGRFEAVVLAAGAGRRFGGGKLLTPYAGGALLDGALAAAFAAPVRSVTVVTGDRAEDVAAAARAYADRHGQTARLKLLFAARHAEGMGCSLAAAAAALPADAAGVFVFLGDMPRVPHELGGRLAAALDKGALAAAPVVDGRRANPVLLGAALIPQLRELSGDEGARAILAGLGERLALVEVEDAGVLFDVDTPEHLTRNATDDSL
jgi:molybdenum cofactor cytidylyltransferase